MQGKTACVPWVTRCCPVPPPSVPELLLRGTHREVALTVEVFVDGTLACSAQTHLRADLHTGHLRPFRVEAGDIEVHQTPCLLL